MICLRHRAASGRLSNVWEFDPARRFGSGPSVLAVIQIADVGPPLALTIPVCRSEVYATCAHEPGDHDHVCFRGYVLVPFGDDEWLVEAARFHAELPHDSLLLTHAPEHVSDEMRAI